MEPVIQSDEPGAEFWPNGAHIFFVVVDPGSVHQAEQTPEPTKMRKQSY